jgi:malonyl-CoA O-methyltransferase|tara:strand:+ start:671 stop:1450 length:780 start_codon:yes stop_codon:yes gene_type:complete
MTALDKKQVAASFGRAASSYDNAAHLQRDIGSELLRQIPCDLKPQVVVDLGCGTGYFSDALRRRFPAAKIIALDLAEGMLQFAQRQRELSAAYLCADAESLPLQTGCVDLIFSSLAIQWCENLRVLFSELQRVLSPNGHALLATLGPETLSELRHAWRQVDDYVHVNQFASNIALTEAIAAENFSSAEIVCETRTLRYEKLQQLTRELKAIGAHNINRGQSQGLMGRAGIDKFRSAYETFRSEGKLPATYEVYYLNLRA